MTFQRLRHIPLRELSFFRIFNAIQRRLRNLPHGIVWNSKNVRATRNKEKLRSYIDCHHGERCFILGNGPSLLTMDLVPLERETTFGLNRIFVHFSKLPFLPTYYVCMNDLVIEQSVKEIASLERPRFINWRWRSSFRGVEPEPMYLLESYSPSFATNFLDGIWVGATVTFAAMQIAYVLGFTEVVLIGVDHDYKAAGNPHSVVVSRGNDTDHFSTEYFPSGFRWQLPDLRTSEYAYRLAREAFEADGRQVLDATIGGKLDVFPKVDYDSLF